MFNQLFGILLLITLNVMTSEVTSHGLDYQPIGNNFKTLDASIYAKILSRLNSTQSVSVAIEDNWRQMRDYLSGGQEVPTYQCQYMVSFFGLVLFELIKCILINEIPGNVCLGCPSQYTDFYNAYTDLTNRSVSNCSDGFVTKDKAHLIHKLYKTGTKQWVDGNCDSCFGGKDEYKNLVVHNDTQYFLQLTDQHINCLNNATNSTRNDTCIECQSSFHAINDYYDLMANNYSDNICNDIISSIKDVRKHWSEELDCPTDFKSNLYILLIVLSVAILPVVLYLTARIFCIDKDKTLMKQKRLSSYHLNSESEPLVRRPN